MPDLSLSEALAEAYASAPADRMCFDTISVTFEGMVDSGGDPTEAYFYLGTEGDRRAANQVPLKDFKIEDEAEINAGQTVEFIALPFDVQLPDVTSDGDARGKLVLDGVSKEVSSRLLFAINAGGGVRVTYRAYLEGSETEGPEKIIRFDLGNVSINATQVSGDIVVPNRAQRRFPRELYDRARFPSLGS